jgi:hypothetical protein
MRHEIEVLRERQQCEARSAQAVSDVRPADLLVLLHGGEQSFETQAARLNPSMEVGIDPSFSGHTPPSLAPLRSNSREYREAVHGESVAVSEATCALEPRMDSPMEPCPSVTLRQEQQELRILALQAKLRHLEQHLGGEMPRQMPAQEIAPASREAASAGHFHALLEAELSSLKQELRAQHMEHAVGMVQEANVLRKDVSVALRNEREARGEDVGELRASLDAMQERLLREVHETMDLIGSRLEQHLQAAVDPGRIDELVSKRVDMQRIISKATDIQQGASSGGESSSQAEIDIEREARCRSIIDLRMEMESKIVEGMEKFEEQCASLAENVSALQETVAGLVNNSQVGGVSFGDHGGAFAGADVHILVEQLEVERTTRALEMKELSDRFDHLASRDLMSDGSTASAESLASTVVEKLQLFEQQMQDVERERSLWHTTTNDIKDWRTSMANELYELRRRDETRAKEFELAMDCERQAWTRETAELRASVDKWRSLDVAIASASAGKDGAEHIDGEIVTLYGMVKEALGDTVRLSVELDTERKTRQRELIEMRKLFGARSTPRN